MFFSSGRTKDINLLPDAEASAKAAKIKIISSIICGVLVAIFLIVGLVLFLLSSAEEREAKKLSDELSAKTTTWQKYAQQAEDLGLVRAKLSESKKYSDVNKLYVAGLDKLRDNVPSGVTLVSLEAAAPDSLGIQAMAGSPTELYQFVEQLKKQKDFFSQVAISSLSKTGNKYVLNLTSNVKIK